MALDILSQIAGQPPQGQLQTPAIPASPGPLQGAPVSGGGIPGIPQGAPSQSAVPGMDPQMAELAMAADQIFQSQTGQSYLQMAMQSPEGIPPELTQMFQGILEQVITGTGTGAQEMAVTQPSSIMGGLG